MRTPTISTLSDKNVAIARARREKRVSPLEQVHQVLGAMPSSTALERRNRALIALAALTGARVAALASFRLGHVNIEAFVEPDAWMRYASIRGQNEPDEHHCEIPRPAWLRGRRFLACVSPKTLGN